MNWKYFKYVVRHKYRVFREGRKLGVPLWALIIHDWQKFTLTEWTPYVNKFMGESNLKNDEAFDRAWLHHLHYGPHHWQYWVLRGSALEMSDRYRREMLADWWAMGDAIEWYNGMVGRLNLHDNTRKWIEDQLGWEVRYHVN